MVVSRLGYFDSNNKLVTIEFHGTNERTINMDAEFVRVNKKYIKVNTYLQEIHKVTTMLTCEEMRQHCIELAKADTPYIVEAGGLKRRITITEINFVDKLPWREPQPYSISYLMQDEDAEQYDDGEEDE